MSDLSRALAWAKANAEGEFHLTASEMELLEMLCAVGDGDIGAAVLCTLAGASHDELFHLVDLGLVDPGDERVKPKHLHPRITDRGRDWMRAWGLV